MARLWKVIDGEPYMINPRLGLLALSALNPKRKKKMAKRHYGARHMAWVRSHRHGRRKRNAYPLAGPVVGLVNRRRRHKRNPSRARAYATKARGFLGLPPIMPIVYGSGGYVAVAGLQGFVSPMLPDTWTKNADGTPNLLTKYGVLVGSLIATTWLGKMVLGPGPAALAGIGGGIYVISQAAHDFVPGAVPGMGAPLNLAAYTPVLTRQLSSYEGTLRASDFGAKNTAAFAPGGAADIVSQRFRRFQ